MSTISNFFLANLAERLTPLLQTPVEDIVYEILDRKGLPTRSEIRDLKNRLERMDEEIKAMREKLAKVKSAPVASAPAVTKSGKRRGRPPRQGPPPMCTVDGCKLPVRSKGFCAKHYQAWRRGRLDGYVDPDGFATIAGDKVKIDKRVAAQPFDAKGSGADRVVVVKGKDYARPLEGEEAAKAPAPEAAPEAPPVQEAPAEKAPDEKAAPKKPAPKKAPAKKAAPKKPAPKKPAPKKSAKKAPARKATPKKAPAKKAAPKKPAKKAPAKKAPAEKAPDEKAAPKAPAKE